eukprot:1158532-Pelagomonas_calceolata.AAC.18
MREQIPCCCALGCAWARREEGMPAIIIHNHYHQKLMEIGGPQVTFLASDHPKRAHVSNPLG